MELSPIEPDCDLDPVELYEESRPCLSAACDGHELDLRAADSQAIIVSAANFSRCSWDKRMEALARAIAPIDSGCDWGVAGVALLACSLIAIASFHCRAAAADA